MYVRKLYDAVPGSKKVDSNAMPDNKMNMLVTRYATSSVLYLNTCSAPKRNKRKSMKGYECLRHRITRRRHEAPDTCCTYVVQHSAVDFDVVHGVSSDVQIQLVHKWPETRL